MPEVKKAKRQPKLDAIKATSGGAMNPPMLEPLSKMATASPRSRAGNHSATVLLAPGQLQPSPMPSRNRKMLKEKTDLASDGSMLATDHQIMARVRPSRVPMRSMSTPPTSHITA